jgi:hypothetical protein
VVDQVREGPDGSGTFYSWNRRTGVDNDDMGRVFEILIADLRVSTIQSTTALSNPAIRASPIPSHPMDFTRKHTTERLQTVCQKALKRGET